MYHSLHGMKLTGLRFFTVYGPLGRPDMAYFGFTQAILRGKKITEFRDKDGTELKRDFTYITDIVGGVIAASRKAAARRGPPRNTAAFHFSTHFLALRALSASARCVSRHSRVAASPASCTASPASAAALVNSSTSRPPQPVPTLATQPPTKRLISTSASSA